MTISLIHTPEVPASFVDDVVAFLNEHARFIRTRRVETTTPEAVLTALEANGAFVPDLGGAACLDWGATLQVLHTFRESMQEDGFLMLLSDAANSRNYFTFGNAAAYVVHTADWDVLIPGDRRIPVAHQVASNVILDTVFGDIESASTAAHVEPRGCLLDLCLNKREVQLKMRTADTCPSCMQRLEAIVADRRLSAHVLHDLFGVLDAVRGQLLHRERLKIAVKTSPIEIRGARCRIWLSDYATEIRLRPQEHAIYLFFLRHRTKGALAYHELDAHLDALSEWHAVVSGNVTLAEARASFAELVDPSHSRVSEKVSRIRRAIADVVGETHAHRYLWSRDARGARRINPSLEVLWPDDLMSKVDDG